MRFILEFYPGFIYIKIFTDLVFFSGTYFSSGDLQFFSGSKLTFSNFGEKYKRNYFTGEIEFYSINHSLLLLLRNLIFYFILIFIFESTLESNQGVAKSLWSIICSCFSKKKSGSSKKKDNYSRLVSPPEKVENSREFEMTPQEIALDKSEPEFFQEANIGIKVLNLSKFFPLKSCLNPCSKTPPLKACNNISFNVKKDSLVTILGQNGAGKTTLINMLTGFLEPSWGEAWVVGRPLSESREEIREVTSLCPQFDIYWPILTIEEHLEIFSIIKGLHHKTDLQREIERTLKLVGLVEKRKERVEFLSGGMRRRLAIAISTIGDPQVIFFDEPTTGLDPVTKDQILDLIKGLDIFFM